MVALRTKKGDLKVLGMFGCTLNDSLLIGRPRPIGMPLQLVIRYDTNIGMVFLIIRF